MTDSSPSSLILGATGFLGRHLSRVELAAGRRVVGAGLDDRFVDGIEPHTLDLSDDAALRGLLTDAAPDRIYYLAAAAFEPRDEAGVRELVAANLDLAARLGHLLCDIGFSGRLVLASSCSIYGVPVDRSGYVREHDPANPVLAYGLSKQAQEQILTFYANRGGFSAAFARLFNLIGPEEPPRLVVSALCERAAKARTAGESSFTVGNSATVRDFLDVRDAARGLLALMDGSHVGPCNLCTGEPTAIRDLADQVLELSGLERWEELDLLKRPYDVPAIYGEAAVMKSLGWAPQHTFSESLRTVWDEAVARAEYESRP